MKKLLCLYIVSVSCHCALTIHDFYMDIYCGGTIDVGNYNQIRLHLTSSSSYDPDMSCQVTVQTKFAEQMMLYFEDLNMEMSPNCMNTYLEIHDGVSRADPYIGGSSICGYLTPRRVFTTSGKYLTLFFRSDSSVLTNNNGFDMVITSYHTGVCETWEYSCDNERCIDRSLKCNGYNPCGDQSDCSFSLTVGGIAGVAVGGGVIIVIVIVIALVVCRRRRRKQYVVQNPEVTYSSTSTTNGYNQTVPTQYAAPPAYSVPPGATSYQQGRTLSDQQTQTEQEQYQNY